MLYICEGRQGGYECGQPHCPHYAIPHPPHYYGDHNSCTESDNCDSTRRMLTCIPMTNALEGEP